MDYLFRQIYKYRTIVKFTISGTTSAAVDLTLLYILYGILKLHLAVAASMSFASAFVISFIFHKFWTFRNEDTKKIPIQAISYFSIAFVNMAINANAVLYLVEVLGVFYLYAQMMVGAVLSVVTFLTLRLIIFKKERRKACEAKIRNGALIVLDTSVEKAQTIAKELESSCVKPEYLFYAGASCRGGCPPKQLYYFTKFFISLYRLSKCYESIYCLDLPRTGLALAILKSMRPDVGLVVRAEDAHSLNSGGVLNNYIVSKI